MQTRVVPAQFTWSDDMEGLFIDASWRWPSLRSHLERLRVRGVLMRAPLWWQLESPLSKACKDAGSFILFERDNVPLATVGVRDACIDAVVTDPEDAAAFAAALTQRNIAFPKLWFLIVRQDQTVTLPPSLSEVEIEVVQEVHRYPGVPLHADL